MHIVSVLGLVIAILSTCSAYEKDILVLLEYPWTKESHSTFFSILTGYGYKLTFQLADSSSSTLMKNGEYIYDSVLIMAPSVREFGGKINPRALTDFVDSGRSVAVVADSNVGEAIRKFGSDCGVDFDEEGSAVIDHFNYNAMDDGQHTLLDVPESNLIKSQAMVGKKNSPILYRGIGMSSDLNNPLLINVLHAPTSAFSFKPSYPITDYPHTTGTDTQLIVALQARNNARVLFIGSMDMLSNNFMTSSVAGSDLHKRSAVSGNAELAKHLMPWVFGDRGVLRVVSIDHHRVSDGATPSQYRILDEVEYTINIETKNDDGTWIPFTSNDVQLELIRIDPFIRRTLSNKNGIFSTIVKLPDVYGVFKLSVDYHRDGYTHLFDVKQIAVRPFAHTEYERFIPAAYPYYAGAISMLAGLLLFSFFFLYFKEEKEKTD